MDLLTFLPTHFIPYMHWFIPSKKLCPPDPLRGGGGGADLKKNLFFVNSEILGMQIWRGEKRKLLQILNHDKIA